MSRWHENITWPTEGGWRCGFYAIDWMPDDADDEWGVEFSGDRFQWVSGVAATPDEAYGQWDGCNPGGGIEVSDPSDPLCAKLDRMAAECVERTRAEVRDRFATRLSRW